MAPADPLTIVVVDGEPLAFASGLAALEHARDLQPGARVGIADGSEEEAGELAARLCAQASAGQVLVSHPVRSVAAERGWKEFRELGVLELGDGGAPVRAWELLWREPGPRTRVRLCGPLELAVEGRDLAPELPGGQASALLAFLLDCPERTASRDELIGATWPDSPPRDPGAALRPILSRLRRALGEGGALEGRERLRLILPEPLWIDVAEATAAIEAARAAAKLGDWESVREGAETALGLLAAGFLPGYEAEWVEQRRRDLEERELEALEWVARSGLALGGPELARAESASRELIARSPYRETGHRFLIEALAAAGNAAEALRAYEALRVLLREELGATPAAELQALHGRLLAGADGAPAAGAAPAEPAAPKRVALPSVLAPRGESAFVGRGGELETLAASWAEAQAGRRRLALVAGEPGIGKTRLMSELALLAQREGTVLYAGCQEEALVSYQPFVEALRHYARSADVDWSRIALGAGAGELALLVPELAAALPEEAAAPAADPETRRYLLFEAVSTLLTEVSQRAPLLLVLDDLHWADRATLHLLRHTIRSSQEGSLLIVGAYRDAEIGPEHPLADLLADLRRDRLFDRVSLDGLDERGVSELIALHAGHAAPAALVGTVHEHTEGNPFFVEEVMRHLIETGVLFERGGRWTSALTADEIGVPEGVRDVLGGRLGRLSEPCRGALAAAAVLGREFRFETLLAMDVADEEALIAALEEAVEAQLVVEASGGATHGFTHALVREALYGGLSGPRRQRMHARAAAALEATAGEPPIAALAVQYRMAGPAGDAEKAVAYSVQAGGEAAGVSAWEEAAAHWEGALAVMAAVDGRERERAELDLVLGDLLGVAGDVGGQIACLEEALALFEGLGDVERTAQAHSRLGSAYSLIDSIYADHMDLNVAFRHFDAARAVFGQGPPRRALGHLEGGVAAALTYGVQTERGIEAGARSMEIGERTGDEVLWAKGAESGGWHLIVSGQLAAGFEQMERALEVVDRERRSLLAWMALNIRGQMSWGLASPDEAQSFFDRHIALPYVGETSFRQETADGVGRCHFSRGELGPARALLSDARPAWMTHALKPLLDLWDGRWDEVAALAARTLETSRRNGNRWDEWSSQHLAARVHQLRGEHRPAVENLERALAIVGPGGARYFELWVQIDLARAHADAGHTEAARRHVDRCLELVGNGEDWRGRAGQVALAEAVVLAAEGRGEEAEGRFAAALASFDRYRLRGDEADALHQWGRVLARGGDRGAAEAKLEGAQAIYREHGAGPVWLDLVAASRL